MQDGLEGYQDKEKAEKLALTGKFIASLIQVPSWPNFVLSRHRRKLCGLAEFKPNLLISRLKKCCPGLGV